MRIIMNTEKWMKNQAIKMTKELLLNLFPDITFSDFEIRRQAQMLTPSIIDYYKSFYKS
jgi:hypothetical protein